MAYNRKSVKLTGRKQHPLLAAIERRRFTYATVARALDVTPQSLATWLRACEENKNFLLPAEQVPKLSRLLRVKPATLRPDLYRPGWTFVSPGRAAAARGVQKSPR